MNQDQKDLIKYVADALLHSVTPTKVTGEQISVPINGTDGNPIIWSGDTTTYTLGLMLSGMLTDMESSPA